MVSVQPLGLAAGTYVDVIDLDAQGGGDTPSVIVYLVVENTPGARVSFSYTIGGNYPSPEPVSGVSSDCQLPEVVIGAASDQGWLAVSPSVVPVPNGSYTITASPLATMLPGTYYGTVVLTDVDGEVAVISCTLTVVAAPTATAPTISQIIPSSIAVNSGATPLRILGTGLLGTSASPCSSPPTTVAWNGTGLIITSSSATEVDVTVPANLLTTPNSYTVTVTVNAINGTSCSNLSASGKVQVVAAPAGPAITDVLSASAYGAFRAVAPGSWVEIYGTDLAAGTGGWANDFSGNNAPTLVDGVSVSIGGHKAFVAYVSPTQVNAQMPSDIATGGMLQITVTNGTQTSSPYSVKVNPTVPGLLAPPASFKIGANQYVVAQHLDGNFVLPAGAISGFNTSPAKPGETIVIYGVGFGSVTPNIPAGEIVTEDNKLSASFTMELAKTNADLGYFGLAPSSVGVYQFNVVVPAIADSDLVPLTFTLGGVASTQTLFTAVQQ
jgi:uncharacterized protein (TIGR03437 family)